MLVNRPVIHLQRSIAPIPGEADNMVLPIIHRGAAFLHDDVHSADVEGHSNFALLLERKKNNHQGLDSSFCSDPCTVCTYNYVTFFFLGLSFFSFTWVLLSGMFYLFIIFHHSCI